MELTDKHKKALKAAGIDWAAFLKKVPNAIPLLIALVQIFMAGEQPVMQSAKEGCSQKEALQCVLHQLLCASHGLCEQICKCEDTDEEPEEESDEDE